jgi:hypothetical protein
MCGGVHQITGLGKHFFKAATGKRIGINDEDSGHSVADERQWT